MFRATCLVLIASILAGCSPPDTTDGPYTYSASRLETGTGPGQLVYPRAITFDSKNNWFYVVDRQAHIQRLTTDGRYMAGWAMPEFQQGKPVGLSVGPDGNVYVPDTHYHRVIVFSPDGKELRRWGNRGSGPGEFIYPTDIAFDAKGNIFVAEYGDHDRIQVFSAEGKYLYEFGAFGDQPGQFSRPQSIVILGDELYLTDACNHRIEVFSTEGKFLRTFGKVGSNAGDLRFPYGLAVDKRGNLLVTEFGNNRIQLFSKEGKSLGTWGTSGHGQQELAFPWAAEFDNEGNVFVVDSGNNRLQILKPSP